MYYLFSSNVTFKKWNFLNYKQLYTGATIPEGWISREIWQELHGVKRKNLSHRVEPLIFASPVTAHNKVITELPRTCSNHRRAEIKIYVFHVVVDVIVPPLLLSPILPTTLWLLNWFLLILSFRFLSDWRANVQSGLVTGDSSGIHTYVKRWR